MDATITTMVPIGAVDIGDRIRAVDGRQVALLAESIAATGLINPITICPLRPVDAAAPDRRWILVAGAHRLQACRGLTWDAIPAVVVEMDEAHRRLLECDENLCGTRLKPAERAILTQRRKEAYEAIHPETRNGATGNGRKKDRQRGEAPRFTADTAARTGQSERAVQRDAKRGSLIDPGVLEAIRGSGLDEGKVLDELAATPRQEQAAKVVQLEQARALARQKPRCRVDGAAGALGDGAEPSGSAAAWTYETLGHANAVRLAEKLAHEHLPDFLAELRSLTGSGEPVVASGPVSRRQERVPAPSTPAEPCRVAATSKAAADPTPGAAPSVEAKTVHEPDVRMEPAVEPAGQAAPMAEPARRTAAPEAVVGDRPPPPDGGESRQTLRLASNWRDVTVEPKPGACCQECKTTRRWATPATGSRCASCFVPQTPRPTGYWECCTGP